MHNIFQVSLEEAAHVSNWRRPIVIQLNLRQIDSLFKNHIAATKAELSNFLQFLKNQNKLEKLKPIYMNFV